MSKKLVRILRWLFEGEPPPRPVGRPRAPRPKGHREEGMGERSSEIDGLVLEEAEPEHEPPP